MLLSLLIVFLIALYFMNADERARLARAVRVPMPQGVLMPALVALHVIAFLGLVLAPGPAADPATLVAFGGNIAPRTTNGEWGRLVTSIFLHAGIIAFAINMFALWTVGLVLERLVGPLTFLAVYIGAGVLAGLVSLSASMTTVTVGASGAIFGLYGLVVALWAHGAKQQATTTVRLATATQLAPAAAAFILHSLLTDSIITTAECTGVVTGFVAGFVLGRWVPAGRPPARKVALTLATAMVIAIIVALPLRGIADVRPVLTEVVDLEARLAREYDAAVQRFTTGRLSATALAAMIEEQLAPELTRTGPLLQTLQKVPPEHRPLVAAAETYVRLRHESWKIRAAALRKGSAAMLRNAEQAERASLNALAVVRNAVQS